MEGCIKVFILFQLCQKVTFAENFEKINRAQKFIEQHKPANTRTPTQQEH